MMPRMGARAADKYLVALGAAMSANSAAPQPVLRGGEEGMLSTGGGASSNSAAATPKLLFTWRKRSTFPHKSDRTFPSPKKA